MLLNQRHSLILVVSLSILGFVSSSYSLQFFLDNYSNVPQLKYSFTYDGENWIEEHDTTYLVAQDFKTINFTSTIPKAWKIEAPDATLHCQDYSTKGGQEIASIVTLRNLAFMQENNLLLDVLAMGKQRFIANIIDLNGNQVYSNTISCRVTSYNERNTL